MKMVRNPARIAPWMSQAWAANLRKLIGRGSNFELLKRAWQFSLEHRLERLIPSGVRKGEGIPQRPGEPEG